MNKVMARQKVLDMKSALDIYFGYLNTVGFMVPEKDVKKLDDLDTLFKKTFNN